MITPAGTIRKTGAHTATSPGMAAKSGIGGNGGTTAPKSDTEPSAMASGVPMRTASVLTAALGRYSTLVRSNPAPPLAPNVG